MTERGEAVEAGQCVIGEHKRKVAGWLEADNKLNGYKRCKVSTTFMPTANGHNYYDTRPGFQFRVLSYQPSSPRHPAP
jgi:hypothetical protein